MLFKKLDLIGNPENKWLDLILIFLIFTSIAGFLTVRGWTNTCFFLLLVPSAFFLPKGFICVRQSDDLIYFILVMITLALPTLAVFINKLYIQNWVYRDFDGPTRMLYSIPIMLYFYLKKVNYSYLIGLASPLALFLIVVSIYQHPEVVNQWGGRFATTFVDPDTLGAYSLVLTSFCLFHLDFSLKSSKIWHIYHLAGFMTGCYLCLGSGTRGSWLAIPFIFVIWLFVNYRRFPAYFISIGSFILIISLCSILYFFPHLGERFLSGFEELKSWIDGTNIDTSTGLRLSMWKISWQLFLHHPLFGYGEHGYVAYLNNPWFSATASPLTKETLTCCGPHNELLANALRSGITGFISVLCLFLIPMTLFVKNVFHNNSKIAKASQLGLAYIVIMMICSISIEVFTLKYTSTFYGLTIAGLMAQIISERKITKIATIKYS